LRALAVLECHGGSDPVGALRLCAPHDALPIRQAEP
jgi:hypothetical protein